MDNFLSPFRSHDMIITPYDYNGRKYYAKKPTKQYFKFIKDVHAKNPNTPAPMHLLKCLYPGVEFTLSAGPVPTWENEEKNV